MYLTVLFQHIGSLLVLFQSMGTLFGMMGVNDPGETDSGPITFQLKRSGRTMRTLAAGERQDLIEGWRSGVRLTFVSGATQYKQSVHFWLRQLIIYNETICLLGHVMKGGAIDSRAAMKLRDRDNWITDMLTSIQSSFC